MYDSYQRGVSTEGIFLVGALTTASGALMFYANKGITWITTTIGTVIYQANDLAASFQNAVIDVLSEKTKRAALEYNAKMVIVAGGVSANSALREKIRSDMESLNIKFNVPSFKYCTDNAAMIAAAAYFQKLSKR